MKKLRKPVSAIGIFATLFVLLFMFASPVYATGGLTISTPYPGTTVTAGKTASFNLTIENSGIIPLNTEVSVVDLPTGWTAQFIGSGNEVSRVFIRGDLTTSVTLNLNIPAGTKEGKYPISVLADAGGGISDTLDMALFVSETEVSQGLFTSQFTELKGGATTTYGFTTDLTNSSAEDRYYSLSADAPAGWQVSFRPATSATDIASVTVPAGQSQNLNVSIKAPLDVKAGEYVIPCAAVSAADSMTLDLKVIIAGTYSLTLVTSDGRLNTEVQTGRETPITLIITNTGSADLVDVTFSSVLPTSGWAVRFDQPVIENLAAGASQEVIAYIQPDSNAVTGDYAANISAATTQASANFDLRIAVKTSTLWGVVAVIIIVLLACGLYLVFKKFGRR